jgi:5-methylcytosine-specific restriction protein A
MNPDVHGGKVDTGYFSHGDAYFILCMVGGAGRTGHNYQNEFDGDVLKWSGRTGAKLSHESIREMLAPDAEVHVFYRSDDRDPFVYAGMGKPDGFFDTVPVRINWRFDGYQTAPVEASPQEVDAGDFFEGSRKSVLVNKYERDPSARDACVAHYGAKCQCCGMDFASEYGELGKGFIHVHHLKPVSEVGMEYRVDPKVDLIPVCPNCHSMIHRRKPPYSVDEIRQMRSGLTRRWSQ